MKSVDEFLNTHTAPNNQQSVDDFLAKNKTTSLQTVDEFLSNKGAVLPDKTQVTQNFGNYNPEMEVFSGGTALDTNFAANPQTPVSLPHGQWYVINTYDQANPQGSIGDASNDGYGNAVMVQNSQTGDKLHFIHLSNVNVKPGQIINGSPVVGTTGSSGNASGPNLGVEYYDKTGKIGDVLNSPYGQYFNVN